MSEQTRPYVKHADQHIEIPDGSTAEDVLAALAATDASLSNAKLEKDGRNFNIVPNLGRKG